MTSFNTTWLFDAYITIITAVFTAIGASNSIPYWYNVGYLEYWGLNTSVLEPARNASVSNELLMSIFVTLVIVSYFTIFALFWRHLDCLTKSKNRIRSKILVEFVLPGALLIFVFNNLATINISTSTCFAILSSALIYGTVIFLTYCLKNALLKKEIEQFSLSRRTPVEIKVNPKLSMYLCIIIIAILGVFFPFGLQYLGMYNAEVLRTAKIINYENEDYMVVASDNSWYAIEKVVEHNGKELYVYTNDVLLLDSDEIKKITLKTYKDIKIEE